MADMSAVSVMAGMGEVTAAMALGPAVNDVAADTGPVINSMCDTACVTRVSSMCNVAGGLTVTTLLALLLASRRNTFMGMIARNGSPALSRRPRRDRTRRAVLSPFSLCVLRV
ncbi:MAG: hypothetical protein ABIQ59_04965 [Nocardioidaceae bacterium]